MAAYGYARVSTEGQTLAAQEADLREAGAAKVFKEKISGAANHRAQPHGRLMLTVLGGLAEFERELIRVRTGEGRVRAKARGVHMGRPFKLNRHQQREAIARREAGEALTDIARTFGVHHTTIGRLRA